MLRKTQWSLFHKAQTLCLAFWDTTPTLPLSHHCCLQPSWSTYLTVLGSTLLLLPYPPTLGRGTPHTHIPHTHTSKPSRIPVFLVREKRTSSSELAMHFTCVCTTHPEPSIFHLKWLFFHVPFWREGSWRAGSLYHITSSWHIVGPQ